MNAGKTSAFFLKVFFSFIKNPPVVNTNYTPKLFLTSFSSRNDPSKEKNKKILS
jgi:hypothetical protein